MAAPFLTHSFAGNTDRDSKRGHARFELKVHEVSRKRSNAEQAVVDEQQAIVRALIDEYTQEHNLTLKAFAKNCNVSVQVLKRIRNGPNLYIDDLFKIARGIEMPVEELMKKLDIL